METGWGIIMKYLVGFPPSTSCEFDSCLPILPTEGGNYLSVPISQSWEILPKSINWWLKMSSFPLLIQTAKLFSWGRQCGNWCLSAPPYRPPPPPPQKQSPAPLSSLSVFSLIALWCWRDGQTWKSVRKKRQQRSNLIFNSESKTKERKWGKHNLCHTCAQSHCPDSSPLQQNNSSSSPTVSLSLSPHTREAL